jgi:hypothetical protein
MKGNNYWLNNQVISPQDKNNSTDQALFSLFSPIEEITFRLDNVLKVTDKFKIEVFHNSVKITTNRPNPSNPGNCLDVDRKISSFSENSRRRLKQRISKIRLDLYPERYFITLTLPSSWEQFQDLVKPSIDKFNKVISRSGEAIHYVWKAEFQKRGALHLHYLLLSKKRISYNDRRLLAFRIRRAWTNYISPNDPSFRIHGVDIEQVRDDRKTINYICKYFDKIEDNEPEAEIGRRWGMSSEFIEHTHFTIYVDELFYYSFRKMLLYLIRDRFKLDDDSFQRLNINYSLSLPLWHEEIENILLSLSKKFDRRFITYQLSIPPAHPT